MDKNLSKIVDTCPNWTIMVPSRSESDRKMNGNIKVSLSEILTPDELSQAAKLADQDGRPFDEELVVLIREGLAIRRVQPQSA